MQVDIVGKRKQIRSSKKQIPCIVNGTLKPRSSSRDQFAVANDKRSLCSTLQNKCSGKKA